MTILVTVVTGYVGSGEGKAFPELGKYLTLTLCSWRFSVLYALGFVSRCGVDS